MADLRELLILVLALAILFSLLRAVYVIHRRRKGQIRLSIDKNLTRSVKAGKPGLSELPNGGARIVGLQPDEEVPSAQAMEDGGHKDGDLAATQEMPVLLDPVEVAPVEGAGSGRRERQQKSQRNRKKKWKEEIFQAGGRLEPELERPGFELDLGAISMTAGERIGRESPNDSGLLGKRKVAAAVVKQPESREVPDDTPRTVAPAETAELKDAGGEDDTEAKTVKQHSTGEPFKAAEPEQAPSPREQQHEAEAADIASDRIIVINVIAEGDRQFAGRELWDFLHAAGLRHDKMKILSKTEGNLEDGQPIFRAANIVNPGTFDPDTVDQFSTPGISMFMLLPAPVNNLLAFEQMLAVARRLAEALDGRLLDSGRQEMTAQAIEQARRHIREFDMKISGSSSVSSRI